MRLRLIVFTVAAASVLCGACISTPASETGVSGRARRLAPRVCAGDAAGLIEDGRQGWGATLAITFNPDTNDSGRAVEPYDASHWDGIALWLRLGDGPSNRALLVAAKDPFSGTTPGTTATTDPYCETADGVPDAKKCDSFGLAVLLEPDWRFVKVPFELMQQKGFGVPSPTGKLDTAQLDALELGFSAGDWDLWLDDISFYREPR